MFAFTRYIAGLTNMPRKILGNRRPVASSSRRRCKTRKSTLLHLEELDARVLLSGTPFSIVVTSGSGQIAAVSSTFAKELVATVDDQAGLPVSGVSVNFTAPSSGASGSFGNSRTVTGLTNSGGQLVEVFTANTIAGSYSVKATANGVRTPATFTLFNNEGSTQPNWSNVETPQEVQDMYGFNLVTNFTVGNRIYAANGQGQTIAIVDFGGNPDVASDLQAFDTQYNLPQFVGGSTLPVAQVAGISAGPTFKQVNEYGGSTLPAVVDDPNNGANWPLEIDLDVEWAHVIAPEANIVLVEINPTYVNGVATYSTADFEAALQTADKSGASVVSMSIVNSFDAELAPPPGVTYVSAAGDAYGSPLLGSTMWSGAGSYDLTVGGTGLPGVPVSNPSNPAYPGEVPWVSYGTWDGYPTGTSWGTYSGVPLPSWQTAAAADVAQQTNMPALTTRMVPDVSMLAESIMPVYDSYDYGASTAWIERGGGTSGATPMWAGLIAIANEGRQVEGLGSLNGPGDPTLPMLYSLPSSDFNHVITDPNSAYDQATGLGSPQANLIIPALVAPFNNYSSALNSNGQLTIDGNSSGFDTITVSLVDKSVANAVFPYVQVQNNNQTDLFSLLSVRSIVLNTRASEDNVTIEATPNGVPLTINLGAGTDLVTITGLDAGPTISGLGGVATVNGGTGTDTLTVNDQMPVSTTPTSTTYYVTDWSIQRNTGNIVNFDNLSQVNFNGVPANSGNSGVDYYIGSTWNGSAPSLMSQPGARALNVNGSNGGAFQNAFYIGGAEHYFGTLQTLNVNPGANAQDAVYIYTLPKAVALNIDSTGSDNVYIGERSEYSLVGILGPINVSNTSGQTSLIVDGTGDTNANYELTNSTLSVSNGPTITYQAPETIASGSLVGVTSIEVIEGGAQDIFDAESVPAQTNLSVHNVVTSKPQIKGPAAGSVKVV